MYYEPAPSKNTLFTGEPQSGSEDYVEGISMQLPQVLILGRPNVGKSTLVNRILGRPQAITLNISGVTRDLIPFTCTWRSRTFELLDSGGVFFEESTDIRLQEQVEALVSRTLDSALKIIFVTDSKVGVHPYDENIAARLRPYADKVILVVNKVDHKEGPATVADFYSLGLGDPFPVSSLHGHGLLALQNKIVEGMPKQVSTPPVTTFKVAFAGRPNVGKSSLLNAILNDDRVIVDDQAGTTRDAIEVLYEHEGRHYSFIDTAGMRRQAKVEDGVEYYSVLRSKQAIREADLVIVLLDASYYISDQDKKIIRQVLDEKKNLIVFINKWDLLEDRTDEKRKELQEIACREFPALEYYPFIFGSAKQKLHLGKLFQMIPAIIESGMNRLGTSELNRFLDQVVSKNPPSARYGRHVKIYYMTQTESAPPVFVFFVNHPEFVGEDYKRFLERKLRAFYAFLGNPIEFVFRHHRRTDEEKEGSKSHRR